MTELLSGADMIARFIQEEGVEYVYGYPGGAALHIYDALFRHDSVKHILVRHEQAATHMADGYARATGKPGVVLVTSGPGATNAVTGIATAYMDSIPMVVLCAQVIRHNSGDDAFQETDILGVTRPIVKHSMTVHHPYYIPTLLQQAFYIAGTGRPGPVVVDIPKDMTTPTERYEYPNNFNLKLRDYYHVTRYHGIEKALNALLNAECPILLAGGGSASASAVLTDLALRLALPVITSLMGIGAYPQCSKQCIGWPGMHGSLSANHAMHNADVILCVGARFDDRITNNVARFCPTAKIIHIDTSSIYKTVIADVPIVGAADNVMTDLQGLLRQQSQQSRVEKFKRSLNCWWLSIDAWRRKGKVKVKVKTQETEVLKPQQVVEAVYSATYGNAFVATDVGQHQMFAVQYYKFNKPHRLITSCGLGTMGFGLPAAMGVKLNFPTSHVVLFTGEGSFQMMMQELSTCKQFDIPIKIVNLNNGSLGMVRQWQDRTYNSRYSHSYIESLPDFHKLFDAYGLKAITVRNADELDAALEETFYSQEELIFLNIYVDNHSHVSPMQVPLGAMNDMV